ncbi:hypothetical protein HCH_00614 [Hahella chejuensis KCTC 2396]|uniref:Immunity MXAN-0049 protein domain-containing protein n=1 Tax=Hahella chejuensis (strain KCTC 2396) TaxID=349521 RepID=Q2SPA8_HAHCH|nr:DUF1629 domain-containing protein [Hahella chejuensis]ABC27516.1 hypothetical protein HCH_00614 [Hahella chejuensis KCTC 2396]
MIYRLKTDYGNLPSGIHFSVQSTLPFKMDRKPGPGEYTNNLEEITPENSPHCKLYKAPLLAEWRMNTPLEATLIDWEIPDILVLLEHIYVSNKAKIIIENNDPFLHQFWPVEVFDKKGNQITGKQFYHMNMRRYVTIENLNLPLIGMDYNAASSIEEEFIPTIQHITSVRNYIETLPLWKHFHPPHYLVSPLFINEAMFMALQQGGVSGIKEYTQLYGKQGEMVAHV